MHKQIAVLPGDGIGPEVTGEAVRLLQVVAQVYGHRFEFQSAPIGGAAVDATGVPLPEETLAVCRESDAILLGAVGGPKWDGLPPEQRPERGLLGIRKALGLFANLRPITVYQALADASTLKRDVVDGVDFLIVRELTGGLYFGRPRERRETPKGVEVVDTLQYTEAEMERILRVAFDLAQTRRKHVTSVDKANVLESSRLWRETAERIAADYPDVALAHMLVDTAAMQIVRNPRDIDVLVTENLFGDILSDEAAMITGSIGMLPSASLGDPGPALFEPVHGSAPDIALRGIANPLATFASVAMMLEMAFCLVDEAAAVQGGIRAALDQGWRTSDIAFAGASPCSTRDISEAVIASIRR